MPRFNSSLGLTLIRRPDNTDDASRHLRVSILKALGISELSATRWVACVER